MKIISYCSFLVFMAVTLFSPLDGVSKRKVESRLSEAKRVFERQQSSSDTKIPADYLRDAYGIIIVKQYKGGFILGAKGGRGVAFAKDQQTGNWSGPAFLTSGEGSIGLQIGGQGLDTVYVILNQQGLEILQESRFRIGVDAAAAAGPVGRNAEAKVGPEIAILAYSRSRGLFAGAAIEGGVLLSDEDSNESYYGRQLTSDEILFQRQVEPPPSAQSLIDLFDKHARD